MKEQMRISAVAGVAMAALAAVAAPSGLEELEAQFIKPPHAAKPHTWYHMMNGNVTKEGITKDFEALARIGVGGVQMFDAGCELPPGPMAFNSPEWMDLMLHAARESKRLGLEIALPNCSGWSSSGGPWITPEKGMKMLVHSETRVTGPGPKTLKIPAADLGHGFYEDIAVIAFPTPPVEVAPLPPIKEEYAFTGDPVKRVFTFTAERPFTANGFQFRYDIDYCWILVPGDARAEASADGVNWYDVRWEKDIPLANEGILDNGIRSFAFPRPVTAKAFRFSFGCPEWIQCKGVFDVKPLVGLRVSEFGHKTAAVASTKEAKDVNSDPSAVVDPKTVRRLDIAFAADGTAVWEVPAGEWTVVRVGYSASGKKNHPASKTGEGLEVDKLDGEAVAWHFEQYVGKLCRTLGPELYGQKDYGLKGVLVDSYEVGCQNWTKRMPEEFKRRRGYAIDDFLPSLAGYVCSSAEQTDKFLADLRLTISELFAEGYGGGLAKKCHEYGLELSLEPYGNAPMDAMSYGRFADIPMGEFWSSGQTRSATAGNSRYASHFAHLWGRMVVGAEAFTSHPSIGARWLTTPYSIKHQGDLAYAEGVNRIIYHRFTHQPYTDDRYRPGFTMGVWGMHFDRTQTWWELAGPWITYQSRCQAMLQAGRFAADVLIFCGDGVPNPGCSPFETPKNIGYDICNRDVLLRLRAEGKELVAPSGAKYKVLLINPKTLNDPALKRAVDALSAAGARVVYSEDRQAARQLAIPSDCIVDFPGGEWIHRENEAADWYFIAMPNDLVTNVVCSFRLQAQAAELWDAETGKRHKLAAEVQDGRTVVTLPMRPNGSAFVVFPKSAKASRAKLARDFQIEDFAAAEEVKGPFELTFPGMPAVTLTKLVDWIDFEDCGKRYFSGTAVYRFQVAKAGLLDLGEVKHFAEVWVGGKRRAILWRPPFRCEVPAGEVEVRVTNLWPNKLIGEDFKPEDCEWRDAGSDGAAIVAIPEWVKAGKPSPTGRTTFTTWKHWTKKDAPLSSGLIGPLKVK